MWSGGKDGDNFKVLPITIIRQMATLMLKEVRQVAPIIFKNIGPNCIVGACPEGKMSCGKMNEIREKFKQL
ncbi:hypothetical protein [Tepidibacter sp.]|uniref:hypothetical protein n=1 Tax=Tepidibacter sp. TaxID=2529387 RepID=UPI002ED54B15